MRTIVEEDRRHRFSLLNLQPIHDKPYYYWEKGSGTGVIQIRWLDAMTNLIAKLPPSNSGREFEMKCKVSFD